MVQNADYHYSITVHTDNLAILYCLRALSMYAQRTGNLYKPWKKASKDSWEQQHHDVPLHFTSAQFRQDFEQAANEILAGRWSKVGENDNDPL
jgi:glycyl-tRNA synthetase alpha subunit